jgi:hypothetical protein
MPSSPPEPPATKTPEPPHWKTKREWAALTFSAVALCVSVAGYFNSRRSSDLAEMKFNSDRALVVVAEQEKREGTDGTFFRFHPLASGQRLSKLIMTVPSAFKTEPWVAVAPDQEMSLSTLREGVANYYKNRITTDRDHFKYVETDLPVVFDAIYSVGGDSEPHRGLYSLVTQVIIAQDVTVSFIDFYFVHTLDFRSDPRAVVDDILARRQTRQH